MKTYQTVFNIYFDGGTNGHQLVSRDGYGSWEVEWNGFHKRVERAQFTAQAFGRKVTNNVAEWLSLIGALEFLASVKERGDYHVIIHGDSQLVLNQLNGSYKAKNGVMRELRDTALKLAEGFTFATMWQKRTHNVKRFGH